MRAAAVLIVALLAGCATGQQMQQGLDALNRGDLTTAEAYFQAEAQRGEPVGYNNLGVVAERRGHMEAAVTYYTLAARYGVPIAVSNLARLGRPVPVPDLANARAQRQASGAAETAATLQIMRALQPAPAPAPRAPVNCTSRRVGNTVQTDCW